MKALLISASQLLFTPLLALLAAAPVSAQQQVFVEAVSLETAQETERVIGSLRARSTSVMAALEEGALVEMTVREADHVKRGAVLARIDTRRLEVSRLQVQADLAMGAATLIERKAQLENSTADFQALESAAKSGAVSDRDLRNARTMVATGKAMVQAAEQSIASLEASRDLLDLRIADAVVRAPFDAQITAKHAEIGQWIRPGDALVTLVSTGPLEAWLDLPERFIGRFDESATTVGLHLEATGQEVVGLRPRSIPIVDMRARTFTLILDLDPKDEAAQSLRPGMSVSATVPLGKPSQHLIVPKDAILRRGASSLVVKIGADNVAQHVPVRVLFTTPNGFAVESMLPEGLAAGDQVIIEGNERIMPGTPVKPVDRSQPADEATPDKPRN
ncbi:MAG: RND family efflux transporter MFP subunit [Bacteroidia bacterium]|jgi:RND family efflux transporter MFP subunit